MKYFTLIRRGVDVGPLQQALSVHEELWDQNRARKDSPGSPHNRMSDIWVRYNSDAECKKTGDWSKFNDEHDSIWYPAFYTLEAELSPIIFNLMRLVKGERLGGVLITRIPPGQGIAPHVDRGWHVGYYDKYYVSIQSGIGATFHHSSGEYINPLAGDIWLFDNRLEHWVKNQSNEDRITLIVCIRSNRARD
jgi:hypothetical protein